MFNGECDAMVDMTLNGKGQDHFGTNRFLIYDRLSIVTFALGRTV